MVSNYEKKSGHNVVNVVEMIRKAEEIKAALDAKEGAAAR